MTGDWNDIALLRAVLLENCESDGAARLHLLRAAALNVDPLDYCSRRFGLGDDRVWQRAAAWARFSWRDAVPVLPNGRLWLRNLDELGTARSLVLPLIRRDVVFAAPDFEGVLALAAAPRQRTLAQRLCFVTPRALAAAFAGYGSERLLDEARQRMTRTWPQATASQDLPIAARVVFAGGLVALTLLAALGTFLKPWLVPLLLVLLMLPGLVRARAALLDPDLADAAPPRLLSDEELPLYTVLVPLRDEANMVPQLMRALSAIDYPALWSKLNQRLWPMFVCQTDSGLGPSD